MAAKRLTPRQRAVKGGLHPLRSLAAVGAPGWTVHLLSMAREDFNYGVVVLGPDSVASGVWTLFADRDQAAQQLKRIANDPHDTQSVELHDARAWLRDWLWRDLSVLIADAVRAPVVVRHLTYAVVHAQTRMYYAADAEHMAAFVLNELVRRGDDLSLPATLWRMDLYHSPCRPEWQRARVYFASTATELTQFSETCIGAGRLPPPATFMSLDTALSDAGIRAALRTALEPQPADALPRRRMILLSDAATSPVTSPAEATSDIVRLQPDDPSIPPALGPLYGYRCTYLYADNARANMYVCDGKWFVHVLMADRSWHHFRMPRLLSLYELAAELLPHGVSLTPFE